MSYQVLSRKWRPQVFKDLIGQEHVTRTLQNALIRERVAHAYIFTGPRGVGKTSTARILAKTLNCPNSKDANPCNECTTCSEITNGNNMDVLEIDGASNRGIDEIRELREAVKYPPTNAPYRIYIIDEVHMLTTQAFNALLKTLEEPPPHVKFIMATTDGQKVPQTIISRMQRFDFKRISIQEITTFLGTILQSENIDYDQTALLTLARKADGSIRDSLSLLDQIIAYQTDRIDDTTVQSVLGLVHDSFYSDLTQALFNNDKSTILNKVEEVFEGGYNIQEVCAGLNQYLRDVIIALETNDPNLTSTGSLPTIPDGIETADVINYLNIGLQTTAQLRYSQQPRILLEQQLLKMAEIDNVVSIREVLSSLQSGGASPSPKPKSQPRVARPAEITPPSTGGVRPAETAETVKVSEPAPRETEDMPGSKPKPAQSSNKTFTRRSMVNDAGDSPKVPLADGPVPDDGLDQLQNRWGEIVEAIQGVSAQAAAALGNSHITEGDDGRFQVNLPASDAFQMKLFTDKQTPIENKISEVVGWQVRLLFTIPESSEGISATKKKSVGDELLNQLIETFKGEEEY